ncbi:hypothetical protein D3C78_1039700 [compost metagenome]
MCAGFKLKTKSVVEMVAVFVISIFFVFGCDKSVDESMEDKLNNIVRIKIDNVRLNIPMRYMYGETIEKWNNIPDVSQERKEVYAVRIDALLPDLHGYAVNEGELWRELGNGRKISISIMRNNSGADWFELALKLKQDYTRKHSPYVENIRSDGVSEFLGDNSVSYYSASPRKINVKCGFEKRPGGSSCKVKSDNENSLTVEYYYASRYIDQWREIDEKVHALINSFVVMD